MSDESGAPAAIAPPRLTAALTLIAGLIAVIGGLVPWLNLVAAWQLSGDPSMVPVPDEQVPRLLFLADLIQYYPVGNGVGIILVAMVASVAAFVLCGSSMSSILGLGQRRAVVIGVGAAGVISALAALSLLALALYAVTSTPDELVGVYFSDQTGLAETARLLELGAITLGWVAVLFVGAATWSRLGMTRLGEASADGAGEDEEGVAAPDLPAGDPPVHEPEDRAVAAPRERVDPARLRPDGSSDSGFDEFHFRR